MPFRLSQHLHLRSVPSFRTILIVSTLLRVGLILYSECHDAHSIVKYTDIDYRVFSDAARFILHPSEGNVAQGPLGQKLGLGDPYTRATYRYTPLLALLLAPNEWLHPSFGKYLFAACDILAGVLIYRILLDTILPSAKPPKSKPPNDTDAPADSKPTPDTHLRRAQLATLLAGAHLLNPLVFTISTRGSSESVLALFVLLTLYAAVRARWDAAAVLLGLSTHWKIYPFVYGVACVRVLAAERGGRGSVCALVNGRTLRFAAVSAGTFLLLGAAMYAIWGYPFLYESYLYHAHRLDHRHNFSPYFYLIYLTYPTHYAPPAPPTAWERLPQSPLTSFVPQMLLTLGAGLLFGRRRQDLVFAWFVQTFVFVIFNKVCTSQYFLWYTLFLPLLIPKLDMSPRRALQLAGMWVGTQALWLSEAYKLEFLGQPVFFGLWVRGLVYMAGHAWVLAGIMESYEP